MLIEFGQTDYKLLLLIVYPVFRAIEHHTKKLYLVDDNKLFKLFRFFLSHLFSGLLLLFVKFRSRKNKKNVNDSADQIKMIFINNNIPLFDNEIVKLKEKNKKGKKLLSYIFLVCLCAFAIVAYFYSIINEKHYFEYGKQSIGIFFEIFFYILLSFLILKQKLYKHNYVSSVAIAIVLLILFIISQFYIDNILLTFAYYFLNALIFNLYDTLVKKYLISFYNSPYLALLIIGSVNTFLLLISDIITYCSEIDIYGVIIGFKNNIKDVGNFFGFILDLFCEFIWILGIWLTIYFYSPCHFFISEYTSEYIYYMIIALHSKNEPFYSVANITIFSIAFFINIIFALVFNEVIIFNFWNLDFNTRIRIEKRMKIEVKNIQKVDA